jgi:hypothetical protein
MRPFLERRKKAIPPYRKKWHGPVVPQPRAASVGGSKNDRWRRKCLFSRVFGGFVAVATWRSLKDEKRRTP